VPAPNQPDNDSEQSQAGQAKRRLREPKTVQQRQGHWDEEEPQQNQHHERQLARFDLQLAHPRRSSIRGFALKVAQGNGDFRPHGERQ
jgi:hypothetical protein